MIRQTTCALLVAGLLPGASVAQDPVERLGAVLPPDVAAQVIEQVELAQSRGLPGAPVVNVALEGVAKGRGPDQVVTAVEAMVGDLGRAADALRDAGRPPALGEMEAATAAMRMGLDGAQVSELARSQPSGRSLAVPLLVMGGLAARGLPSDQALSAVLARLAAGADDAALIGEVPGIAGGRGRGGGPDNAGLGIAGGMAGFQVPVAGVFIPVGPHSEGGVRPGQGQGPPPGRGRGGGPGGAPIG